MPVRNSDPITVKSRSDLASRHGSIGRIAAAHSCSYRSDNPICTRTPRAEPASWDGRHGCREACLEVDESIPEGCLSGHRGKLNPHDTNAEALAVAADWRGRSVGDPVRLRPEFLYRFRPYAVLPARDGLRTRLRLARRIPLTRALERLHPVSRPATYACAAVLCPLSVGAATIGGLFGPPGIWISAGIVSLPAWLVLWLLRRRARRLAALGGSEQGEAGLS